MKSEFIEFNHNARTVFTGVKFALEGCGEFRSIKANERTFRVEASHGLPILGENVEVRVVALSAVTSRVEVRSSDKLFYNIFKWGNNKRNVGNLMDFIQNRVNSYFSPEEVGVRSSLGDTGVIRIVQPEIKMNK